MAAEERQRLDKWLWFARVVKTRTLAQKLALSGHVRVNREKAASAHLLLKAGDVLTITGAGGIRILKVVSAGTRRGPAAEARLLYEDLSPASRPGKGSGLPLQSQPVAAGSQSAPGTANDDFSTPEE
jgi:ribosome-associated heat shock protein Hsp15